ncbi:hypothetical protein AB0M20_22680, partial [Actinoplanes sp. NPDC051633]|uniref:hypothetical protein n=1 Tax=Actinoplanes sp. NPDC051633 TaxID=3155670 RepID=UPI0034265198
MCVLRDLARSGRLAATVAAAGPSELAALGAAAYEIVWPVVYQHLTRGLELRRGHRRCASGVTLLTDECLDRFHDDVEAVVHDLLRNAHAEIQTVEAWLHGRLTAATVDGNRRRRGRRGALQRPRMSGWLAAELGHDRWLIRLALHVLEWVGVPETAGSEVWPLDSWVALRPGATGDWDTDVRTVRSEVDLVLTAMRRRPDWYASYIERPLGAKIPPVAPTG